MCKPRDTVRKNKSLNDYNDSIPGRTVLRSNNSLLTIHPYYDDGLWVFDDERVGLIAEPFVSGADDLIDHLLRMKRKRRKALNKGFTAVFSMQEFKGADVQLEFRCFDSGGSVYEPCGLEDFRNGEGTRDVWLCPALNLYFEDSPKQIWISIK